MATLEEQKEYIRTNYKKLTRPIYGQDVGHTPGKGVCASKGTWIEKTTSSSRD